ncbi:uncharacterized protein KY384_006931 [Bacidia gigantensis]|uniref:uncharacterized protein n=1 Tax=Bacidia gigantensis TaxID=2732470 RepID=UPI001D05A238|nr:uncharacterized protein KY384_006931 [Bacidia gigantensis]KAG8528015.1 hypothetical protein KY384_006931 [Bacidia gigantensis]
MCDPLTFLLDISQVTMVAPAVTNETIQKRHHEETTTAIDKEVHQDHYHTAVQPVKDREVLPEQHHERVIPVEHREHHHGNVDALKRNLEHERTQFQNTRVEGSTKETHSVAPVVAGEHVHHHVHETIQPVVQKETIQPSVMHTTVPVHEVHHNDAKHHAASALPAISMADFKKQGGALTGREERSDGFEGEPKAIGTAMDLGSKHSDHTGQHPTGSRTGNDAVISTTPGHGSSHGTGYGTGHGAGVGPGQESKLQQKLDPRVDSDRDGSRNAGLAQTSGTAGTSTHTPMTGTGPTHHTGSSSGMDPVGSHASDTTATKKKPSIFDKINPKKDADGDGKPGFMR